MSQLLTINNQVEIAGSMILPLLQVMGHEALPLLQVHDFSDIDPHAWYPARRWLDFLADVEASSNSATFIFVRGGIMMMRHMLQNYDLPEIASPIDILSSAYRKYHRNSSQKCWSQQIVNSHVIEICSISPYPDSLEYGLLYGLFQHLYSDNVSWNLTMLEEPLPRSAGSHTTVYRFVKGDSR